MRLKYLLLALASCVIANAAKGAECESLVGLKIAGGEIRNAEVIEQGATRRMGAATLLRTCPVFVASLPPQNWTAGPTSSSSSGFRIQ
jgi:hypothetical protein